MAIGLPLRKYIDDDELGVPDFVCADKSQPLPVERNDIFLMLGHKLRVTTVLGRSGQRKRNYERKVFLTCADDCNCCDKFHGKLLWPVRLQILERHLHQVALDKL